MIFSQNFIYTLGMCFFINNVIFLTRLMQTGDKAIIRSMIDVDQTIAAKGLNKDNMSEFLDNTCKFDYATMEDGNKWVLCNGFLIMFLLQKFVFTALTLSCPIPGGIFTPTFAIGAVFG